MSDFVTITKGMTAIEVLNYYRNCYYAEPQTTERGIVANAINDILPKVTELVHGRWIDLRESSKDVPKCRCSVCSRTIIGLDSEYKFCPNCGTKMDGGDCK